ncbi:dna topoisomerase iii, partial [Vairimorpha apis BRL 01]
MKILNISEKPSIAKLISSLLSKTVTTKKGYHKYCPNIHFKYDTNDFIFTSVLGHLIELNFIIKYKWEQIDPKILFKESVYKKVQDELKSVSDNILKQCSGCDLVVIWTDCDREGEHIAQQIHDIIRGGGDLIDVDGNDIDEGCIEEDVIEEDGDDIDINGIDNTGSIVNILNRSNSNNKNHIPNNNITNNSNRNITNNSNRNITNNSITNISNNNIKNIKIKRARFNAITKTEIITALKTLTNINKNEAHAVDCRMELDLRIGSSFTILQTLSLKHLFNTKRVISFGPCQIPTLGFVVDRYFEVKEFVKEDFYSLNCVVNGDVFKWKRGCIFDKNFVVFMFQLLENGYCDVKSGSVDGSDG